MPAPLFRFANADHDEMVRTFLPYIETLRSDDEAWAALFADAHRLAIHRSIHGNKRKRTPKPKPPSLFDLLDTPSPYLSERPTVDVKPSEEVA
jgi:hypothetical protein